jgi:hypothetical protein
VDESIHRLGELANVCRRQLVTGLACQKFARNYATRDPTIAYTAIRGTAAPPARLRGLGEVPHGGVNHRRIDGMQEVRGSNPLSSTSHNASTTSRLLARCQQIVSRSRAASVGTL